MILFQTLNLSKPLSLLCAADADSNHRPFLFNSNLRSHGGCPSKLFPCFAVSGGSDSKPHPKPTSKRQSKARRKTEASQNEIEDSGTDSLLIIPRKPRRGRRSEAVAVEDFVRGSLTRTFESIRQKNPEVLDDKESLMKEEVVEEMDTEDGDDEEEEEEDESVGDGKRKKKKMVVEEESKDWPLDADVGWGIRASEYFEKHPIKNVVGEDGFEIDWEGEIDDNWVSEINCLEWESMAFHPSPLIVLVFERYNRATDNWKTLKELEKAAKVYWSAKDRLPPRTVKIDINIERDLAYALKVKQCPQILFLRGDRIMYREKEFRTSDELVQMIAHFYYNAKRPSWVDAAAIARY
ncbi:Polyadenylate-binding protein 2-binding protein 2 [Tripterygium wilfordii]|uniref:Polyadenylate-binding protein 2-binding protein 2 n=1 Tax=Tripterygium wilfordii TaxID=458696 RepID=A0A7J7D6A4_TRIWF|nr:thioredoxin-like fold domain-containing protein MRL7, chloroplastic [Tripterygium wilfordii]KAF5741833.1 Polyadenylate-binding protein 2-binding protein 2 [Tripterygium wilfordii]